MIGISRRHIDVAILVRKQGRLKIEFWGTLFSNKNCYDDSFAKYRDRELKSSKNRQGKKVMGLKKAKRKEKFRDFII